MTCPEHCVDSRSREETLRLGCDLGRVLEAGDVIGVSGDMGAGKTCLVQGIAQGLDVPPEVPVTSPSFTLIGEYPGRLPLRHADFYRVESYARLLGTGFEDLLDGEGVVVVEWPELWPDALPEERLEVRISLPREEGGPRRVAFGGQGPRARELERKVLGRWR